MDILKIPFTIMFVLLTACQSEDSHTFSNPVDPGAPSTKTTKPSTASTTSAGTDAAATDTGTSSNDPAGTSTSKSDVHINDDDSGKMIFEPKIRTWYAAEAAAPKGYHIPTRAELLQAFDAGELKDYDSPSLTVWTADVASDRPDYFFWFRIQDGFTTAYTGKLPFATLYFKDAADSPTAVTITNDTSTTNSTGTQNSSENSGWKYDKTGRTYLDAADLAPTGYRLPTLDEVLNAEKNGELTSVLDTTSPYNFIWTSTKLDNDYFATVLFGGGASGGTVEKATAQYQRKCLYIKE